MLRSGVLVKCIGVKYIGALSAVGVGEQKGHKFEASLANCKFQHR